MKLIFGVVLCRHFSSQASFFARKKSWGKNSFQKYKKKYVENGPKAPKMPKIKWTHEQEEVLGAACTGQSVFITGSAGTGKTFLLETIIKKLKRIHGKRSVYVTAPTGVAACALNGQTLHSFSGVGIADTDRKSLLDRVQLDRRACNRWKNVKALVIDEISMVDAALFEGLEYVARTIREDPESKTWGGIQLIVSGDFFQLPPVLKEKKKGTKVYTFEADCWDTSFDRQIELTTVFRQSDSLLIQLLQGIRKGENDPDDLKLLEGCCSGFEPDPTAVRLYPMNADVSQVNKTKMESLNEEIYAYTTCDMGEEQWMKQLKSGIAPDVLELCVGARVMLTKNVKPWRKLVNGATGTVIEFCKVSEKEYELSDMCTHGSVLPVVKFDSGLELVVEPELWVVMDGDKVVAVRRQVPLILSWALSIHKCQGMTLDKLHTDLSRVFDFGMVYVALSRVKSLTGLHLSGLNPSKIKAHPSVLKFYNNFNRNQDDGKKVVIAKGNPIYSNKLLESSEKTYTYRKKHS